MRDSTIYAQAVRRIEASINEFYDRDSATDSENDEAILSEALRVIGDIEGTLYELTEMLDHNGGYQ